MKKKREINTLLCNSCNGEFLCVKDCVTSNIEVIASEQIPHFKERGFCIDCGHCNSICPQNAISIRDYGFKNFDDSLFQLMAKKRTVRNYKSDLCISEDLLELIVAAAQSAPTEKNRNTVNICFIKEKLSDVFNRCLEVLKCEIDRVGSLHPQYSYINNLYEKRTPVFWGAEYMVVLYGKPQFVVDAAIAAERMQLIAYNNGISSGYNGNLAFAINHDDELQKILNFSTNDQALVSFALGYSEFKYNESYISERKKISFI